MPVYETITADAFTVNWKGEIAARVNDILQRSKGQFGHKMEEISRFIEKGLGGTLSSENLKSSIRNLIRSLKDRHAEVEADGGRAHAELDVFFEQIIRHRGDNRIEQYSTYLFTVDLDLKI